MMEALAVILVLATVLPIVVAWLLGQDAGASFDWRVGGLGLTYVIMPLVGKDRIWAASLQLGPLSLWIGSR